MEEIQQTLEQMANYMNIVAIMSMILMCTFCFILIGVIILTLIEEVDIIRSRKNKAQKIEESNNQSVTDLSLKEKSQSKDCDKRILK